MKNEDPLIRATKKAYRSTKTYEIDRLLAERARWSRKVTIASNKLADVNAAIVGLCKELAGDADKKDAEWDRLVGENKMLNEAVGKLHSQLDKDQKRLHELLDAGKKGGAQ